MKKIDLDREIMTAVPDYMVEQRTLLWYLDRALSNFENMSDRKLAARLEVSPSVINAYRHKHTFPSDQKMIEIAALAQVPAYVALIDLNLWRTDGVANETYSEIKEILKRISAIIIAVLISISPLSAKANVNVEYGYYGNGTVYYGK